MGKSKKRRHADKNAAVESKRPLKDADQNERFLITLLPAISHPSAEVRKLALQKLKEREDLFGFDGKSENVFDLMLAVEEQPLQFENFRERGTRLRRLRYGHLDSVMSKSHANQLEMLVFRFVLAQFFENLADYWPLVTEVASTFSRCANLDEMWSSFEYVLVYIHDNLHERTAPALQLPDITDETIQKEFQKLCDESETRVNFSSLRLELYNLLSGKFVGLAERKHHYLIGNLVSIYENEFKAAVAKIRRFDDITSATWYEALDADEKAEESNKKPENAEKIAEKLGRKLIKKTLISLMNVFAKFSIDEDNTKLAEEDRADVIPVLLNLLDGKMHTKTKKNIPRRPIIFRFVASCRPNELELFLKTTFWAISDLIDPTSIRQTCSNIIDHFNPVETIAMTRLTGLLDCLEEIYKKLARSLNEKQNSYVYQVTIVCNLLIRLGLEHPQTSKHFQKILRNLRAQAFDLLHTLFNAFQRREFTTDELNVLFEECIRPYLSEKETNADLPWSILKFFGRLTEITHFYPLLNIPIFEAEDSKTALGFLCDGLFVPMLTQDNRIFIVERVINLMTFFHEESVVKLPELRQARLICPEAEGRSFGTRIVINHVSRLIAYLKDALPKEIHSSSQGATVNFTLLEKISAFSSDPSLGADFAATLLPFVESGFLRSDDNLASVLVAIGNFVVHDSQPEAYFQRVSPFLSKFQSRKTRNALLQLLKSIQANSRTPSQLKDHIECLQQLEAWDPKKIEEPDHERRHETMAKLAKLYESECVLSIDVMRAYLHSHFYALSHVDEISIRSASSNCLRLLILRLKRAKTIEEKETTQKCLREDVLSLVQGSIKSKNENIRHEAVYLLMVLIDNFGDEVELIKPLRQLRNTETPNQCFFENVTHLQIHRRQRAFIDLRNGFESGETQIPIETIDKFLTPLVRPYLLLTEQKLVPISDESIRLYAIIMRQQPWRIYHGVLNSYIDAVNKEVENNKPNGPQSNSAKSDRERFKQLGESLKRQKLKKTKRRQFISYTNSKAANHLAERLPNLTELNDEDKMENLSPQQRILATTLRVIIPRLRKCIRAPQEYHSHKKAQKGDKYFADEEEINRAPIAIATVKLLKKLPSWAMDMHLQGVIFTVLNLLLSRSFIVREAARKAIEQIIKLLGPAYLPIVLNDLRQNLTRGYQVHVMIFTVHSLISCLQDELKPGDLDDSFDDVFEVVKEKQFGQADEESQLNAIKAKTPEAKSNKTSETFTLLGRYITDESLNKFIEPMREIIEQSPKIETYRKLQELLRALSQGLRFNQGVSPVALLDFSHSILDQYIEEMSKQQAALRAQELQEKQERESGYRGPHCLLLQAEPKRAGATVKTSAKSKVSVFVEFGLQLLGDILSEKHFKADSEEDTERLDPYLDIVLNALRLKYEKTTSSALRVLVILLKFPLPSITTRMPALVDRLFILLSEYANATGTTKTNVNELNQHLFKAVVTILRKAPEDLLTKRRLQILLNHVESDLLDPHKQVSAFTLAKAIISRHIKNEKIDDLIKYLAELSVTSPIDQTRSQARSTIQTYFRAHPSGVETMESINALFRQLDEEIVDKCGFSTFVQLASRFIKDDNPECQQRASDSMRELFLKVSNSVRNDIYLALSDWIQSEKPAPRYIGTRAMAELLKLQEFESSYKQAKDLLASAVDSEDEKLSENASKRDVKEKAEPAELSPIAQLELAKKRAEKKNKRRELLLANPELATRQKQKRNKRKSEAKKRKLDEARPYRVTKRRRREEIRRTGEID
ncbi:Small subunit processome component 20-like protein [Aphelenchoides bicaudatus]|nr:Small subunit processome component 20-like protein [Aphelenchoides bicaudatus]